MIPESCFNILPSETNVATASESMTGSNSIESLNSKANNYKETAFNLATMTSSYLHRIPSGSRQWEIYLKDLIESRAKRAERVKYEQESVTDFLQRFPLFEA